MTSQGDSQLELRSALWGGKQPAQEKPKQMKWSEAKVEGKVPAARGGHAGVSFGNSCYYFGGADR